MHILPIVNYNYNNRANQSKLSNANAKNISVPPFRGTVSDTFHFSYKYTINDVLKAKITDGYKISAREAQAITDAIPLMAKTQFSKEDYEKLSIMEKTILREIVEKDMYAEQSINEDINDILDVSEELKKHLDEKYPEGYKLVGIGRSPEPITDAMRALGADAVSIPFSRDVVFGEYPYETCKGKKSNFKWFKLTKNDWQDYFKYYGLDVNEVNLGKKKVIFTDYVSSGASINLFKSILSGTGFLPEKVKLRSIKNLIENTDCKNMEYIFNKLGQCEWKKYSKGYSAKEFNDKNFVLDPKEFNRLPQSMTSKLFEFALYDKLAQ